MLPLCCCCCILLLNKHLYSLPRILSHKLSAGPFLWPTSDLVYFSLFLSSAPEDGGWVYKVGNLATDIQPPPWLRIRGWLTLELLCLSYPDSAARLCCFLYNTINYLPPLLPLAPLLCLQCVLRSMPEQVGSPDATNHFRTQNRAAEWILCAVYWMVEHGFHSQDLPLGTRHNHRSD